MTREQTAHLSEEAINDLLIGLGSAESRAHLATCPVCSGRVKEFQSGVDAFNLASLAWSEARPYAGRQAAARWSVRRVAASPWSWALAAALLVVIGIPTWNHNPFFKNNATVSAPRQGDSEAQIAQDNDLLRSVNVALAESEQSPINEYNLLQAPHPRLRTRLELRKQ